MQIEIGSNLMVVIIAIAVCTLLAFVAWVKFSSYR